MNRTQAYLVVERMTKYFSRHGLYERIDREIAALNARPDAARLKILNIGAGGEVGEKLKSLRAKPVSLDADEKYGPDVVGDACEMTMFADGEFDAVFMIEVLEHVKTPQRALDEVRRVLKKGGLLILSTPFIFPIHDAPNDFFRYTKYGLAHLLRDFGSVRIEERNDYLQSLFVLVARMVKTSGKKNKAVGMAVFFLLLPYYPLIRLVSRVFDSDHATTGYFATAAGE